MRISFFILLKILSKFRDFPKYSSQKRLFRKSLCPGATPFIAFWGKLLYRLPYDRKALHGLCRFLVRCAENPVFSRLFAPYTKKKTLKSCDFKV